MEQKKIINNNKKEEVCSYTVRRLYNIKSVTSGANVQNVVQCHFHMRGFSINVLNNLTCQ